MVLGTTKVVKNNFVLDLMACPLEM